MELLLLLVYAFFVWLVFIKLKWLPWTFVSQVIVVVIPVIALATLILFLNVFAPSTNDVRVLNYVVQVVPRVSGLVIDVPVEPNRPVKKGDVLFRIDPVPFQQQVNALEAKLVELRAKVLGAGAYEREVQEQLQTAIGKRGATESRIPELEARLISAVAYERELRDQLSGAAGKREAVLSKLQLARKRVEQFRELVATGAGTRFDLEQAETEVRSFQAELDVAQANEALVNQKLSARTASGELAEVAQARAAVEQGKAELAGAVASESQVKQKLSARTAAGDLVEVAEAKAQVVAMQAQLEEAKWKLSETVYYAPADGTVVNLQLRVGAMASQLPLRPVMSFVENEQWVIALFSQNEVREVRPGNDAEIALETYPGRIIKCKVDSVVWATAQGQLPIGGTLPDTGEAAIPPGRLAVRLQVVGKDKDLFLAAGARGMGAIYTDRGEMIQVVRKVILRVGTKLDWLVLKLH